MRRCLVSALALWAAGCALEDGQPWGRLALEVEAAWEVPAGRLDDAGRLLTPQDYAVRVDALAIELDAASATWAPPGGAASGFDPANPPAGYSLCHNGHCHAADGLLVEYADIAAEQATGGAGATPVAFAVTGPAVSLTPDGAVVTVGLSGEAVPLERGRLTAAEVRVVALRMRGVAFDRLDRLPAEGVPFDVEVALDVPVRAPLDAPLDRDAPVGVDLSLRLVVPPSLLDGLDFSATPDVAAHVAARLAEDLTLNARVARHDD